MCLDRGERRRVAFGGGEQLHGLDARNVFEIVPERAPDPDRLAAEIDHHATDHLM